MKILLFFLSLFGIRNPAHFSLLPCYDTKSEAVYFVMDKKTTIHIQVNTNVSPFIYTLKNYAPSDTLIFIQTDVKKNAILANNCSLNLPVEKFKNESEYITSLFQETVHIEKFPNIILRITNYKTTASAMNTDSKGTATIEITVAGIKRFYIVHPISVRDNGEEMTFSGNQPLLFSDFNLNPPSRILGMIKSKNEMLMTFNVVMKKVMK